MILTLLALLYVAIGVLTYGLRFAYFQREWPTGADDDWWLHVAACLLFASMWPAGLLTQFLRGHFRHGLITEQGGVAVACDILFPS